MASVPKTLEIVAARQEGPATRVLTIAEVGGAGIGETGGKYIIVDTGLVRADRAVKRAYSLMSGTAEGYAEIAVKRFGVGSGAMHEADVGATFTFSGPWGKLLPTEGLAEHTLVVATDTGITSALGIVDHAARKSKTSGLTVLWLFAPRETFLSPSAVRARVESAGARLFAATIPEVDAPDRTHVAFPLVEALLFENSATHVVGIGDGAIVCPLREILPGRIASVKDVRIECFFHNPEKKSG